jgi:membrane fusion protein (multidrug efflux system)
VIDPRLLRSVRSARGAGGLRAAGLQLGLAIALTAILSSAASAQGRVTGAAAAPAATTAPAVAPAAPTESAAPIAPAAVPVRVLLIAQRETTIVAQMAGRVDSLGGELGARVDEGAALVRFDCGEAQARRRLAEAELDAARQTHDGKVRLQSMAAAGDIEVQLAAAGMARAQAQLDLATLQAGYCRIDAPFAGRIVKLHVRPFQGVTPGQPLLDIVSTGPLKLRVNAPSRWLSWLKPGIAFRIEIDETGRSYPAVVTAINGRVDAASQSVEIEGAVRGNPPELLAGMSGNALFPGRR